MNKSLRVCFIVSTVMASSAAAEAQISYEEVSDVRRSIQEQLRSRGITAYDLNGLAAVDDDTVRGLVKIQDPRNPLATLFCEAKKAPNGQFAFNCQRIR